MGATPPENRLDFWREDPLLNDHHDHWHDVYPFGLLRPEARRGELFAYMHEQMIARYDAERLAVELPRVQPFDDYHAQISEGYDPGMLWTYNGVEWWPFPSRPAGVRISDQPASREGQIRAQETYYERLFDAAELSEFNVNGQQKPVTADNLGDTVEPNVDSLDFHGENHPDNFTTYGAYHGTGHVHIASYDNQPGGLPGPMAFTETAVRDPIFWRWHKHVDSIFRKWQEREGRPSHDFSNGPPVRIRNTVVDGTVSSSDIILCLKDGLPDEFDGEQLGSEVFGYSDHPGRNNWDEDFVSTTVTLPGGETVTTTDELLTEMRQRAINFVDETGGIDSRPINHLSHDDFFYFIRVQNLSDQPQSVTARIYLAPATEVEDRTSWIELDKFLYQIESSEHAVIFRPAELSSVVRKPALKPDVLTADQPWPTDGEPNWCDCGWPYTLLLPRGTESGMEFRLFVIFTPGDDLESLGEHPEHEDHGDERCTSISYCGLQTGKYPDKREMGYPFNQPFSDSISATVERQDNMAWRTIKIRCRNP